jgi:hypothetical protein
MMTTFNGLENVHDNGVVHTRIQVVLSQLSYLKCQNGHDVHGDAGIYPIHRVHKVRMDSIVGRRNKETYRVRLDNLES